MTPTSGVHRACAARSSRSATLPGVEARRGRDAQPLPGPALGYRRSDLHEHGRPPGGWREVIAHAVLGEGVALFDGAADDLLSLTAHARAGIRTAPADPPLASDLVVLDGPMRGPCRLVDLIDESLRQGVVVGTLEGNTAVAEHRCHLDLHPWTGEVTVTVRTVWRPRTFSVLPGAAGREARAYERMGDRLVRTLGGAF